MLGTFRVLRVGKPLPIRAGGKMEALLTALALRERHHVSRDVLLEALWPETEMARAVQSLNTLVHELRQVLGRVAGQPPIVRGEGGYRLNVDAGVVIDVSRFAELAELGDRHARRGDAEGAAGAYRDALALYRGDLCAGTDVRALVERERLRATHLSLLARLADLHFQDGEHSEALRHAQRLLMHDPCREDAHRLVMRCHARLGERAQALKQFRVCRDVLRREFDVEPEAATVTLFARLRTDPGSI